MTRFNVVRSAKQWKAYVEQSLLTQADRAAALAGRIEDLQTQLQALANQTGHEATALRAEQQHTLADLASLASRTERAESREKSPDRLAALSFQRRIKGVFGLHPELREALVPSSGLLFVRRDAELLALIVTEKSLIARYVGGAEPLNLIEAILDGSVERAFFIVPHGEKQPLIQPVQDLLEVICEYPVEALAWARDRVSVAHAIRSRQLESAPAGSSYFDRLDTLLDNLHAIDFFANEIPSSPNAVVVTNAPFSDQDLLAGIVPAQPKRRSVLFPHHCYYNFYYLAGALRARGWDALSISFEAPDSPNRDFYHGEDEAIYDPDPIAHRRRIVSFLRDTADRFGMIHSYGVGALSLFPFNHDRGPDDPGMPWDILEAKRRGVLIGYSHSGCLDGVSQESFKGWSPSLCANCVWQESPAVCSDARNRFWGRKLTTIVDLFCTETDPPLDYKGAPQAFRAPLTFAMDPNVWRPDIQIPEQYRRDKRPGEILVYHAVGNYQSRSREGRNVKGTGAVVAAVEQLRAEGIDIRLDFVHGVPSSHNRFIQVQADIIVDQLHYGRYGALAREGMLLGRPVVGRVEKSDGPGREATRCIQETPIVHADEHSILDVLRDLALNPEKRAAVGAESRRHAIKWWSADRLAARFEQVYDHLREHGRPPAEEDIV